MARARREPVLGRAVYLVDGAVYLGHFQCIYNQSNSPEVPRNISNPDIETLDVVVMIIVFGAFGQPPSKRSPLEATSFSTC